MNTKRSEIIGFAKGNRKIISYTLVFGFLSITSGILIPLFLGKYYQLALHTHSPRGKIFDAVFGYINDMEEYFLFFGVLVTAKFLFDFLQKYFAGITGELFSKGIRDKLFAMQLATPLDIHRQKDAGKYLLRYSGDLSSVQNYFTKGILAFFNDCLFVLTAFSILALINLELTLIVLIIFPLVFIITLLLNGKLKRLTRKRRNIRSGILSFASSRLNALLTIKIFNRESVESDKFEKKSAGLYRYGEIYFKWHAFISALLPFMLYVMLGIILLTALHLNNTGAAEIDGSVILIFIMLMINTMPVLKRILRVNLVWQAGDVSFRKLLVIFNTDQEDRSKHQSVKFPNGNIVIKELSFRFRGDKKLFDNFSCEIPGSSIIRIDGSQGSGKSTLFKIFTGLSICESGSIVFDDFEIEKLSKHDLRKNISMVSDELPLIGNTVFETISYSRRDEKRNDALLMLNELGFRINNCTSILDYPVFEGGRNLSAGQRKLLMIARAFLTNKKIYLLDEPFVQLDSFCASKVIKMLNKLRNSHSIIVVDKENNSELIYDKIIFLSAPRYNSSPIFQIN